MVKKPYIQAMKTIEKLSPRAGAVAQLGEHRTCTAEVAGSNPVSSTLFKRRIICQLKTIWLGY